MEEKEVELIDYLRVIWKRKWLIIIGTLLCILVTIVMSFLLKPIYEIDTIILPGKFFVENQSGNFNQVVVEEPQQIADKVTHKSFDAMIAADLNLDISEIPDIKSENIRNTLLTRIWIRKHDVALGKKVLHSLLKFIKREIDEKIDIEISNINADIKENEILKDRRAKEIEILKKKLKIIDQRKRDIIEEMKSIRDKINELEKEQLKILKKENRTEIESLGMLLYSNEIQESLRYSDILNEKLSDQKYKEEDINSNLEEENAKISQIENNIANLKERKGRIDYTKVVKEPTSSLYPVYPKKKLNVLVAGIFGSIILILVAFFSEYVKKGMS